MVKALLSPGFMGSEIPLLTGTVLSLTIIGFGVLLTTHGATRPLSQLKKTIEDIKT